MAFMVLGGLSKAPIAGPVLETMQGLAPACYSPRGESVGSKE
jgi:hypothetical protein